MSYDFSKIPVKMQDINAWLLWHKYPQPNGTIKKIPDEFSRNGKTWDNINLLSFTEARSALFSPSSLSDGIGIAFTKSNHIAGVDIDGAMNANGEGNEKVFRLIYPLLEQAKRDGCYIEKSISGTGFHIYGTCTVKEKLLSLFEKGKIVSKNIEIYFANSYFTVSGDAKTASWGNIDNTLRLAYKIIKDIKSETPPKTQNLVPNSSPNLPDDKIPVPQKETPYTQNKCVSTGGFTDEDVMKLPLADISTVLYIMGKDTRKHGAEASEALMLGYPADVNKSDYDEKIIGVLCYWLYRFGEDAICNVFRKSRLYRPHDAEDKEKRKGKLYLENSVHKAYANAEKFFPAADYNKLSDGQKARLKDWIKSKE